MHWDFYLIISLIPTNFRKDDNIYTILKGVPTNRNIYRGITLVSCYAKVFSSSIDNRLHQRATDNDVITDAQLGLKMQHS